MGNAKRIILNALFQTFSFIAKGGSEIIISIVIARFGGIQLLGEYAILIALALLFKTISAFGLPSLLTREISRVRNDTPAIHGLIHKSIWLSFYTAIITLLFAWGIEWLFGYQGRMSMAMALLGVATILDTVARVYASAFRGIEKMQWSSGIESLMELGFLFFGLGLLYVEPRIDFLMTAYLIARCVALASSMVLYYRYFGWEKPQISSWVDLDFIKICIPFVTNNLVSFVQTRFDTILVLQLAGPIAVGTYEPAASLTKRMNVFSRILSFAIYPFFSSQFIDDKNALYTNTVKVVRFLLVPACFLMIILLLEGENILLLLYGEEFLSSVTALTILALSIPFRFIGGPLATALSASDRQRQRTFAATIAAVSNIVLNLVLIPTLGIAGVAIAALLTESLWILGLSWYLWKDIKQNISVDLLLTPGLALATIGIGLLTRSMFSSSFVYLAPTLSVFIGGAILAEPSIIEIIRALVPKTKLQSV